eukprot:TRINITY_DN75229_c0_g1_i1.p1 TRINITY_DN75229_c0_g1~~TRINITY_DN75229_c0_g1_i1.p1  ORF type:complete len:467 (+),score=112.50 TRINITY_DN75229_c0_g1_i1:65-1465(+)
MEVALVLGGASMAGALLGAVAAWTKLGRSSEQALVPWTGEERKRSNSFEQSLVPAKVRRLNSSLGVQEQDACQDPGHASTDAEFGQIVALAGAPKSQTRAGWCATQARQDCEHGARESMDAYRKRIKQDLALIHAALLRSLPALREGSPEVHRHVSMLSLLGKRVMLEPALLDALPVAAEAMKHRSRIEPSRRRFADGVLAALERGLLERAQGLESRLRKLASEVSSGSAGSSTQLQAMPAARSAVQTLQLANQASATLQDAPVALATQQTWGTDNQSTSMLHDDVLPARAVRRHQGLGGQMSEATSSCTELARKFTGPSEQVRFHAFWENEQLTEDEEPMEEALWKALQTERSEQETPFIPLPPLLAAAGNTGIPTPPPLAADKRATAGPDVDDKPKNPSELALLAVLDHGTEDDIRIIKGMRPADVKKVLAHRRKHGVVGRLEELPKILGRKISLQKLQKDNPA